MQDLSSNITIIRHRWDLSQDAFGLLMGVTRNVVMNWERGRSAPNFAQLAYLGGLCGLPVSVLSAGALDPAMVPATPVASVRDMREIVARLERIEGLLMQIIQKQ